MSPGEFHSAVYNTAIALGANDVQARLAAAQASEETGYGKSMVGNNAFGIKAGSTYTGPSVTASTEEEYNGNTVRENANFRAYENFTDSVKDYLSTMQSNFPDAWNATSFPDAVAGLKTGVYGAYATRAAYPKSMLSIDNKYGALSFAQNPDNVPAPYGPNDPAPDYAVPDDVLPMSEPNFVPMSGEFAFAARPTNVPVPEARPEDIATPGLLTSYQPTEQAPAATPFDAVTPGQWGLNKNVAPALIPTVETWSDLASAAPVQAPMGSVQAQGFLGANPGLQASATAGMLATPSERMGLADPSFDMSRFDGAAPAVASDFDMGRFAAPETAAFDQSRFGPPSIDVATNTQSFGEQPAMAANLGNFPAGLLAQREVAQPPSVQTAAVDPGAFDLSRFGQVPTAEFDQSRFGPSLVNPATNVASFADQPADLGSMPDAYAAQRGPTSGLLSADAQTVQGMAEANLSKAMTERAADPTGLYAGPQPAQVAEAAQATPTGFLNNPAFAATNFNAAVNPSVPSLNVPAVTPSLASAYVAPQAVAPAVQAIEQQTVASPTGGLLATPAQQAAGYQQFAAAAPNITNLSGFTGIFDDGTGYQNAAPVTAQEPGLDTVDVADQPTIAGPATDTITAPSETETATTSSTTPSQTVTRTAPATVAQRSISDRVKSAINPGTAIGAAIGGGLLGVPGAAIGGFLGNAVNQGGFLSSAPVSVNNIGSGSDAVYSVWGGAQPIGTQATASDGQQVTSMGNGYTALTGKSGAITVFDQNGKAMAYHGTALGNDEDAEAEATTSSGGFFGGLFG